MEWFENEEFWTDLFPYMFPAERFSAAADQVSEILALAQFKKKRVLDLCCGPGRHSVELARRGLAVTGVDRSSFLLKRARELAVEAQVRVEWVMDDMRRFKRPRAFDLACSLFTSFGYFKDEEDDLRVLRNVAESLTSGGVFVIDVLGKELLARRWENARYTEYPDGTVRVERPQLRGDWSRLRNDWTLIRKGRSKTFRFEHSIYSGRELKDRLLACGFDDAQLYGDLQGTAYGLDSPRLIAVARKV